MKRIPLTHGKFAIVDDADYAWLHQFKWFAHWNKNARTFYAARMSNIKGKQRFISMAREILGLACGGKEQADHRNHNTLDNRRGNLRKCSRSQNQHNQRPRKGGTSKYKGVCWNRGRWQTGIQENGKQVNISRHKSEEDAARAYNKRATELFGDFACLNRIGE